MPLLLPRPFPPNTKISMTKVLHYKMNDNAESSAVIESTTWSVDGVFVGNLGGVDSYTNRHDVAGKINNALNFDWGTTAERDYIDGGTAAQLLPPDMTISVWFRSDNNVDGNIIMAWATYFFVTIGYKSRAGYNSVEVYRAKDTGNYIRWDIATTTYDIFDGNWHHLLITMPNTTTQTGITNFTAYLNSTNLGSSYASATTDAVVPFANFSVGDTITSGGYPFKGDLDDIRIYNRGLSTNEEITIYNRFK